MKFIATDLDGAYRVEMSPNTDARGYFARLWCREEFRQHGIQMQVAQVSLSHNSDAGTLRGLHFQWPPSFEAKLVRCESGCIHDVIVDLRPDSPTFTRHSAFVLDSRLHNALYVPAGFAHGFQALEADTNILYTTSDVYRPDLQAGLRYDDPAFNITWPLPVSVISPRDRSYPDFDPQRHRERYARALQSRRSTAAREPTAGG